MAILTPRGLIKIIAAAATPELLGDETIRMHHPLFMGRQDAATVNTGTITIQFKDDAGEFIDVLTLPSGEERVFPLDGCYRASDFKIKAAEDGDGVVVAYANF